MTTYTIHTWNETHPQGIGPAVAERNTYHGARAYAARYAQDYDGGLQIRRPDGIVDTGRDLIAPDGTVCAVAETRRVAAMWGLDL